MEIPRAKELIKLQIELGGGYNRNSVRMILAEIQREYGQETVDALIREFHLNMVFGFKEGQEIKI